MIGTLAAFTIGVPVGKILFPPFNIDSLDLGLLAAGSGMFIIALTVAQALLALKGHARPRSRGSSACSAFVVVTAAVAAGRRARACRSSSASSPARSVATLVMGVALYNRMKHGRPRASVGSLIDQIEHEPLEI